MTRDEITDARRFPQLRREVAARRERGDSLERVERELIARSGLSEDLQSALWLYAWALRR